MIELKGDFDSGAFRFFQNGTGSMDPMSCQRMMVQLFSFLVLFFCCFTANSKPHKEIHAVYCSRPTPSPPFLKRKGKQVLVFFGFFCVKIVFLLEERSGILGTD